MENYLVYVKKACSNSDGSSEYDFFFSETPDVVWGVDWNIENPSSCTDLTPDKSTVSKVRRVKSSIPFKTFEEMTCYSMEYAIEEIVALAWIDITNMEEYPSEGRCVFHFGDSEQKTEELLGKQSLSFKN